MTRVVLFAVGSPLVVDAEETCTRAAVEIVAGVRNVEGPVFVSGSVRVVDMAGVDDSMRAHEVVVALFTPAHRKAAYEGALRAGFPGAATIADPTSPIARSATIGAGVFVNAGCVIAGASTIGNLVVVNRSASIGHHASLGDYVSLGPGVVLAGFVTVGRGSVIGAGAVVLPGVSIGENAVVAAGAVVGKPVPDGCVARGNPCRILKAPRPGYRGLTV